MFSLAEDTSTVVLAQSNIMDQIDQPSARPPGILPFHNVCIYWYIPQCQSMKEEYSCTIRPVMKFYIRTRVHHARFHSNSGAQR